MSEAMFVWLIVVFFWLLALTILVLTVSFNHANEKHVRRCEYTSLHNAYSTLQGSYNSLSKLIQEHSAEDMDMAFSALVNSNQPPPICDHCDEERTELRSKLQEAQKQVKQLQAELAARPTLDIQGLEDLIASAIFQRSPLPKKSCTEIAAAIGYVLGTRH